MLIAARFSGSGSGKDLLSRTADETEVRRQIEEIERRHGGIGETPTEGFWRALWKIHSACGLDVPRFPEDAAAAALDNLKHLTALAEWADTRAILDEQALVRWRCCRPGSRNYRRRLLD